MIILAPLHGYTDFIFRNVYERHFSGIDLAVSPFISLTHGDKINPRKAKDVMPANNHQIEVVPQILGNEPDLFIQMCDFLNNWGYNEINWNLGCPVKNIANKKRGSGLLPFPDLLREILEKILPNIRQNLSIKIRLGYFNSDEIFKIIPVLNDFPLKSICIHPRIGTQMYEGEIHHDTFEKIIPFFKHELIYNGDIVNLESYRQIKKSHPKINKWMIGRGAFYNPFLPSEIKNNGKTEVEYKKQILLLFFKDLYYELSVHKTELSCINKIKDLWQLFCEMYSNKEEVLEQILHSHSLSEISDVTEHIIATYPFSKTMQT